MPNIKTDSRSKNFKTRSLEDRVKESIAQAEASMIESRKFWAEWDEKNTKIEAFYLEYALKFLVEVNRVYASSDKIVRRANAIKLKITTHLTHMKVSKVDSTSLQDNESHLRKSRLMKACLELNDDKIQEMKGELSAPDENRSSSFNWIYENRVERLVRQHKDEISVVSEEKEMRGLSNEFLKLYIQVLDFAKATTVNTMTRVINPNATEEDEPVANFDLDVNVTNSRSTTLESTAHTPGLTHFNQRSDSSRLELETKPKKIDWDKDINECDDGEISLRFSVAYSLQCDKEIFVWPFSTMFKKVKNYEAVTVQEIKSHALTDTKSRTAQVVKSLGLKLM